MGIGDATSPWAGPSLAWPAANVAVTRAVNGGDVDGTGHYYNNVDCEWTLECWSGTPVLEFQSFDTEGNFDYVYITDDSGARLYTFDGTSDSHSYSSHGPPLLGSTYNASRGSSTP